MEMLLGVRQIQVFVVRYPIHEVRIKSNLKPNDRILKWLFGVTFLGQTTSVKGHFDLTKKFEWDYTFNHYLDITLKSMVMGCYCTVMYSVYDTEQSMWPMVVLSAVIHLLTSSPYWQEDLLHFVQRNVQYSQGQGDRMEVIFGGLIWLMWISME